MWNPFKKKSKELEPKPKQFKQTLHSQFKSVNVGKTYVKVELEDGNKIELEIVGNAYPTTYAILDPIIHHSLEVARNRMADLSMLTNGQALYDYNDPTTAYYSKPVKAVLSETIDFEVPYTSYYVTI